MRLDLRRLEIDPLQRGFDADSDWSVDSLTKRLSISFGFYSHSCHNPKIYRLDLFILVGCLVVPFRPSHTLSDTTLNGKTLQKYEIL